MRFSEQWLREWVNPSITTDELVAQLTMAGLEVDAAEPVAGQFSQVVVGEVLAAAPHPDAKKLQVCQVEVGSDQPLTIVCGAPNARAGIKVAVALVGAQLPGGLEIKAAKIRGQSSEGMLCAEAELGMSDESEGIMELPADAPIGYTFRDYLQLDDTAIEVDLTPNRGDCLSLLGLARETAVLNRIPFKPQLEYENLISTDRKFPVTVSAPEACSNYVGRVIEEVNSGAATPVWMQERLRRSGIRSIDIIVDITNYVMLELGQPMHAFDLNNLKGNIDVRYANEKETLVLLDGQELTLKIDSLVIADKERPLALAGVMGGKDSGIKAGETTDLFLESAFFDPVLIAGKARAYGLHTDSSHRFERGVDFNLQKLATERATELILEFAGGRAGPITEVSSAKHLESELSEILLRRKKVDSLLGFVLPTEQIEEIIDCLGLERRNCDEGWWVKPNSHRFDIRIEVDLIEELGRVYGYNNIPMEQSVRSYSGISEMVKEAGKQEASPSDDGSRSVEQYPKDGTVSVEKIKANLVARGYQEVITYSFVDPEWESALNPEEQSIRLANPIASDMGVMRTSLWPGLLKTAQYNLNRQVDRVRIFESGLRFRQTSSGELEQEPVVAGLIHGALSQERWCHDKRSTDFFDVKGDVVSMFDLGRKGQDLIFKRSDHPALHPGQSAEVWLPSATGGETLVGRLGALHPNLENSLGFSGKFNKESGKIYLFELVLNAIRIGNIPKFTEVSKFPLVKRDLALIIDTALPALELVRVVKENAGEWLTDISIFDLYEGENIGEGKKSIAVSLTLQHPSRTLNEDEINGIVEQVVAALISELKAILRE